MAVSLLGLIQLQPWQPNLGRINPVTFSVYLASIASLSEALIKRLGCSLTSVLLYMLVQLYLCTRGKDKCGKRSCIYGKALLTIKMVLKAFLGCDSIMSDHSFMLVQLPLEDMGQDIAYNLTRIQGIYRV